MNSLFEAKRHNELRWNLKDAGIWNWEWLGPGNIGGRLRAILIHPTNPNIIWVGSASGGIWKTIDGGASWSPLSDFIANLAITSLVMDPNDTKVIYASTGEGFGNADGLPGAGVFKTIDGGNTWTQLAATSTWRFCNRLAHHPTISNIIFATVCINTSNSYIGKSSDGGLTWAKVCDVQPYPVDIKICPNDANKMVIGCYNTAYYSSNGGATLTTLTTGVAGKFANYPASGVSGRCEFAYSKSSPNIVYASLDYSSGQIYKSTDYGLNWTLMNTGSNYFQGQGWYDNAIAVSPTDPNLIVVGGMDIWKSTNSGTTLTKISNWTYAFNISPFSPHADHHCLVFSSSDNGTTYKILFNGSDGGICKNNDITTAAWNIGWVNLNNGLGITQFYGGAAAPDGSVIIGGAQDNGNLRFRPADGPNSWFEWSGGDGGFCAINYNNPLEMYQEYIYLLMGKTVNGGNSGTGCTTGLTDAGSSSKALFIAPFIIDPNNPSMLVAGGN